MRSTIPNSNGRTARSANCGNSGRRATRRQRSAGGWASRRMPSSERRTSRPAGTTITDPHRQRLAFAACAAPAACAEACGHHPLSSLRGANIPKQSNALLQHPRRHDVWRRRRGASVRTRAAGRLGSQARRHSGSVMIRRRSTCRTATSMRVAPTRLVAGATRQMKYCSLNFCEHQGGFDVCGAAEATVAARVRRSKHPADRLCRLHPCPSRRPAAVEMGLQEDNGDPYAEVRTPQTQRLTATS